jgi:hypothetical protein
MWRNIVSEKKSVDTDSIYNKWLRWARKEYGTGRYLNENREELIYSLISNFLEFPISEDDIRSYKRKVMDDLITEEGKKVSGKKNDPRCNWYKTIEIDFDSIVDEYFDPNSGLAIEKKVVYSRSKFLIPEDPQIVEWVKSKYGDKPDLIEQAHNVNNTLCLEYFSQQR